MAKKRKKKEQKGLIHKIAGISLGILLWVFSICLILSMFGYNPADESFNVSNSVQISNFMGKFGSYSSDFIVNSFGLAIFIFLIPLVVWGYLLIKHQKILELKVRIFAVFVGIISLAGALHGMLKSSLDSIHLTGKFSHLLPNSLMKLFANWNLKGYESILATILLSLVAVLSFNLAVGITFKQWAIVISKIFSAISICVNSIHKGILYLIHREVAQEYITPKKKEKSRKEPVLSTAKEEEKSKETPNKKATAKVIPFNIKTGGENSYKYPDINLLSRPKEKLGLSVSEKELNERVSLMTVLSKKAYYISNLVLCDFI